MDLVSDLHGAVQRGEIVAAYQPQVDLDSLEIVAVEALARWHHPGYGLVPPGIFIPLAEAHGLIDEIGVGMIDEAVGQLAEWNSRGFDLEVAINVSALQLKHPDFLDRLQQNFLEHRIDPSRLVIEITESLPVVDSADGISRLTELADVGLTVSVDDFGSGYSALADLVGLPAREIKIDRSLIQEADASPLLLKAVVETAHARGMRVVAEGIETQTHLALARELQCDRGQGHLFGRPNWAHVITSLLTDRDFGT
ncbi:MAG TPA: EAL domain-containing protein [Galbitalea sp.]|jgi:EAL domain-containing protein (putative c-di-GMP-specific phosphodiesterase class I)